MLKTRSGRESVTWSGRLAKGVIWIILLVAVIVIPSAARNLTWGQDRDSRDPAGAPSTNSSSANASSSTRAAGELPTLMEMYWAAGTIGIVITLLSIIGLGFVVEHFITIRRQRLIPDDVLAALEPLLGQGRWDEAMAYCCQPENDSLITDVVLAGLERCRSSEFGFADYKSAIEEAGEEYTSRLYRKIEVLNVIAVIAPMLGLLGTVQGMIMAFNTIAAKGGMARPDELAGAISLALVTTFEGLVVAIPAMVASSFFRNKIDSLVSEAGKRVERITAPLGRRRT